VCAAGASDATAGTSNRDVPMPRITQRPDKPFGRLLVLPDDECAFACATGADQALAQSARDDWAVVSIKDESAMAS
jgi:hypothetical protein